MRLQRFLANPEVAGLCVGLIIALFVALGVFGIPAILSSFSTTAVASTGGQQLADSQKGLADPKKMADKVERGCKGKEDLQGCLEGATLKLVDKYGPLESIQAMNELMRRKAIIGRGDYHDYVHRIGRATAKKEGLNPDAFFQCPVDYNYGCQHGFFEQALVAEPDPNKAARLVCDPTRMNDLPSKFLFYCYHGVGHGLLMAAAYDVQRSLDICDAFSNETERGGCHQGVFMENINESIKRFRETQKLENNDPLFPCNDVDEKYRQQCFMNHGGYIMNVVGSGTGAVEKASAMCLKAGNQVDDCLLSLGMLSTNAGWQSAVVPYGKSTEFYDNALRICAHFVKGTEQKCLFAGISNLSNMYASDIAVSITLCGLVKPEYRQGCFQQIGFTQRLEYPANTQPEQICKGVPRDALGSCFRGAQGFPPE